MLLTVIMRYKGFSNADICKATIVSHINNWNKYNFKSLKDNRGGSMPKLDTETLTNLNSYCY